MKRHAGVGVHASKGPPRKPLQALAHGQDLAQAAPTTTEA